MIHPSFIYFDKKRLPFKPEKRQVIYLDVGQHTYGLTSHINSHYDEISQMFSSNGFDFIFLPKIISLFYSEGFYRYILPNASNSEISVLMRHNLADTNGHRGLSMLLNYVLSAPTESSAMMGSWENYIDYYPIGLICYAGETFDSRRAYAFQYMPFDKSTLNDTSITYQDFVDSYFTKFIDKMKELHELVWPEKESSKTMASRKPHSLSPNKSSIKILLDEETGKFSKETNYDGDTRFSMEKSESAELPEMDINTCEEVIFPENSVAYSIPSDIPSAAEEPTSFADENFSTDVREGLTSLQALVYDLINNKGISQLIIGQYLKGILSHTKTLSHLHIRGTRIFLTDYNNMEITMGPLPKAVFLLFLRHKEGIRFSYLPDYRQELLDIYSKLTSETDRDKIRRSVEDVTDPTKNTINENASRIRRAFVNKIEPELAKHYYITGERGEAKKIELARELVVWNSDIIPQKIATPS